MGEFVVQISRDFKLSVPDHLLESLSPEKKKRLEELHGCWKVDIHTLPLIEVAWLYKYRRVHAMSYDKQSAYIFLDD
jgi:hypothetical protein